MTSSQDRAARNDSQTFIQSVWPAHSREKPSQANIFCGNGKENKLSPHQSKRKVQCFGYPHILGGQVILLLCGLICLQGLLQVLHFHCSPGNSSSRSRNLQQETWASQHAGCSSNPAIKGSQNSVNNSVSLEVATYTSYRQCKLLRVTDLLERTF